MWKRQLNSATPVLGGLSSDFRSQVSVSCLPRGNDTSASTFQGACENLMDRAWDTVRRVEGTMKNQGRGLSKAFRAEWQKWDYFRQRLSCSDSGNAMSWFDLSKDLSYFLSPFHMTSCFQRKRLLLNNLIL